MTQDISKGLEFSAHDAQLVRDATELLIECRHVLAWTYVWAFFQQDEAVRRLFEFTQQDLETKTEQLSSMVEDRPAAEVLSERMRLTDFASVLRGYLENFKRYGEDVISARKQESEGDTAARSSKRRRQGSKEPARTGG